ncbi:MULTISPECIES: TIGR03986 family CRISPR-associated RAMP protein [Nostocaceae]|uniref:TIGR03986 family type III CRISPR-associated RAMP protein n=1 Tax=Nostocaceae TaxID=1162 RepID=UPI0018EF86C5|nr:MULTISPECIES: TIGR03986 family CRISPR-associated RAMP protein [Nostocaceae]
MKKHIRKIQTHRQAIAPYNFVELPDKIVTSELEPNGKLRDNNRYYSDRHTGRIECTLTTSSPLYIRCGLTQEEFKDGKEAKNVPDFYYIDPITKKPVLPGSSLRGMLRNLIEIITFSKISQVSDFRRLFFRAVATLPKDDSLAQAYRQYIDSSKVKAGYLKRDGDTWKITPAKEIKVNNSLTSFAWVKEEDLSSADFPELKRFDDLDYLPQYLPISYQRIKPKRRYIAEDVTIPKRYPLNQGTLVTSGNMKETSDTDSESIRTYHCVVFAPNPNPNKTYIIDSEAKDHYLNALTDFQKKPPFDDKLGMLQEGRPVFYCQPQQGNIVTLFGYSPYFRIPYSPNGDGKAATVVDFIPEHLRDDSVIDIAEAIFGFVRRTQQPEGKEQSRAGRISVSDATCETPLDQVFMNQGIITPKILASPKPTTYQHYLVQPEETNADKSKLKHYASQPTEETVIRGHKLYWHKGSNPDIQHPKPDKNEDTQTQIKPINPGVTFKFTIRFENLTNVELGALIWILDIAQNDNYRLSLGMGKPLGMGAVKIASSLYLSKRKARYSKLFNNNNWEIAEDLDDNPDYQRVFENYILQELRQTGKFQDIPRIQMLLKMLSWQSPSASKTRYMEIEREQNPLDGEPNEYKNRRVLPTPLDV